MLTIMSLFDSEGDLVYEEVLSRDPLQTMHLRLGEKVELFGKVFKLNCIVRNFIDKELGLVNLVNMEELVN